MTASDPLVNDLFDNALGIRPGDSPKSSIYLPASIPPNTTADNVIQYGEEFGFALSRENRNPLTCAFAERLFFPVNPEEFARSYTRAIGTYDILNAPQATQLGNMQVRVYQLSSFFPFQWEDDYCIVWQNRHALERNPQQSILWLEQMQRAGYPLMFNVIMLRNRGNIFGSPLKVVISNLGTSYRAGNPMDAFFDLELTEYVEPTILRTNTQGPAGPAWKFKKYVTIKGDTLISIARKAYGNNYGAYWKQIYAKNKTVVYKGKKHSLRDSKGHKTSKPNVALLVSQHLVIPQPKATPR